MLELTIGLIVDQPSTFALGKFVACFERIQHLGYPYRFQTTSKDDPTFEIQPLVIKTRHDNLTSRQHLVSFNSPLGERPSSRSLQAITRIRSEKCANPTNKLLYILLLRTLHHVRRTYHNQALFWAYASTRYIMSVIPSQAGNLTGGTCTAWYDIEGV